MNNVNCDDCSVRFSWGTSLSHDTRYFITSLDPSKVTACDLQKLVRDGCEPLIFKNGINERNFFDAKRHDVANGVVLDLAVFAIGLAKQIGRRRLAIRNGGDVHEFAPEKNE